jgi:hypothetical protein
VAAAFETCQDLFGPDLPGGPAQPGTDQSPQT